MAGTSRFTAVLDANVLYPNLLRDLLVSLAVAGLYSAKWTERINDEWTKNLKIDRPDIAHRIDDVRVLLNQSVPDCLVENYEALIPGLDLPDPDDRHVLAAAIAGHADTIVTMNLKDFPAKTLAKHSIEVVHPDDFIMNQLELSRLEALATVKQVRARFRKPPISVDEFIGMMQKSGLPQSAQHLAPLASLI